MVVLLDPCCPPPPPQNKLTEHLVHQLYPVTLKLKSNGRGRSVKSLVFPPPPQFWLCEGTAWTRPNMKSLKAKFRKTDVSSAARARAPVCVCV